MPENRTPAASTKLSEQARWLFGVLAIVALTTVLAEVRSANDASRMSLVQALVEHHTLIIDQTVFMAGEDKSWVNGHFYSDKPATPSLIAALVYAPLYAAGISLGYGLNFAYYVIVLAVSKSAWWLGALAFYKGLRYIDVPEKARLATTLALSVGSLYLTFSAVFSNHGLAAAAVAGGWFCYLRAVNTDKVVGSLTASGLLFGLAAACDFPVLIYGAGVGVLVLWDARLRRGVWAYSAAAIIALVPGEAVNYAISGSLVPLTLVAEYYLWPGSPWRREDLTGASRFAGAELLRYGWSCLVGGRGFVSYNPLVVPAVVLAAWQLPGLRKGLPFAREAAVVLGATAILWGYYIASSTNFSGYSYSIRWFVPSLPVLLFFLVFGWKSWGRWWPPVFWVLLVPSVLIAVVGCLNPWSNISISQIPFVANLVEHWPQLGAVLPR